MDDAGLHAHGITPFPGADLTANPQVLIIYQEAMTLGVMLPTLSRARGNAEAVKSASNLRQIGQGCLIYANDNKQKLPPNLGTVMQDEGMEASVFLSPFQPETAPVGLEKDQLSAWVNDNSAYIYLGAGKTTNITATTILVYEKPGLNPEGASRRCLVMGTWRRCRWRHWKRRWRSRIKLTSRREIGCDGLSRAASFVSVRLACGGSRWRIGCRRERWYMSGGRRAMG